MNRAIPVQREIPSTSWWLCIWPRRSSTIVRYCDAAFRYHSQITKEYKDQNWARNIGQAGIRLLTAMADFTDAGQVTGTLHWLMKASYKRNGGPYLQPGETRKFRHFQIRLLLEHHRTRRPWSARLDLVLDRWDPSTSARRDLEDYLRANFALTPQIETVTFVDSLYADLIQIADLYTRVARLTIDGSATAEHSALAGRLFVAREITRGLY